MKDLGESMRLAKVDLSLTRTIFGKWYGDKLGESSWPRTPTTT